MIMLDDTAERYGMRINMNKIKAMRIKRAGGKSVNISININKLA